MGTRLIILLIILTIAGKPLRSQHKESRLNRTDTSVSPYFSILQYDYDVKFYYIDLDISNMSPNVQGKTSILVESLKNQLDTLVFELNSHLTVDSVFVNEESISSILHYDNLLKIPLLPALTMDTMLMARIHYKGSVPAGGFFSGVRTAKEHTYDKWVSFTLSEPYQSMNWFPCKQDLRDKADSAYIFLTVDNHLMAGSNGLLTGLTAVGSNKTRYEWKTFYPFAYYLLSFAVADYKEYTFHVELPGTDYPMPVQNYIYNHPSLPGTEKARIDVTEDLLLFYSDILGIYPFHEEKYGHCLAPMGGGMEHQTMTTLTHFNFALVAHELAHQWYGNYLTCKTWQDIWINEGFASYLEYYAIEKLRTKEEAAFWLEQAHSLAKEYPDGSVFLQPEETEDVFRIFNGGLSYKKGAILLNMLKYELGNDQIFFNILRNFLIEHAFGVASGKDFLEFVNAYTNEDFTWFFDQWYYGSGYPVFLKSWSQTQDSLIIESIQETSSPITPFFRTKMDYTIVFIDGSVEDVKVNQNSTQERFSFHINKPIEYIIPDPGNIILKNLVILRKEKENQLFELSSNPFNNNLTIRFRDFNQNRIIRLTSLSGKQIFETTFSGTIFNREVSFVKPGIYILSVFENNVEHTLKVVKME